MKRWQRALGNIRFLGPDVPSFRKDCKFLWDHIERLEAEIDALRIALLELQQHGGEGE